MDTTYFLLLLMLLRFISEFINCFVLAIYSSYIEVNNFFKTSEN